jgi:dTDP-4-dehydrorhamnose reductase
VKLVVTGAGGQLGVDVVRHAESQGDTVVAVDRAALDIRDRDAVHALIGEVRPDAVVNAAAYTAVDACETEVELAHAVNGAAVGHLAEACRDVGAHLVHVSTDYVFDGELDRPYREDDATNPRSVYGQSKLVGERLALPDATVVRTSWVNGEHGGNMVKLVLGLAADPDRPLAFVDDQRGCPTFTADLAPALRRLAADRHAGVVHLTNAGPVSWYEFVGEILRAAGHDPRRVSPISTADLQPPRPAPRPANSVLDNAVWRAAGHPLLRDFRQPLAELVARLR